MSAREQILDRVKAALKDRQATELPGPFRAWRPEQPADTPVDGLALLLEAAGGEVVRQPNIDAAAAWLGRGRAGPLHRPCRAGAGALRAGIRTQRTCGRKSSYSAGRN